MPKIINFSDDRIVEEVKCLKNINAKLINKKSHV